VQVLQRLILKQLRQHYSLLHMEYKVPVLGVQVLVARVQQVHLPVLEQVAREWYVDRSRLLLTGMSDGGTFTLLSGLDEASPFTHLAPVAASFHPLLMTMTDPRRVIGLPMYLVHGALDWMFPVSMARAARHALTAAGATLVYREIADLSHVYPREEGGAMLDWLVA